jgi:high-affinity nickel-transport protein
MFDVNGGVFALLLTALVLGFRHGIDWDHLAAITDITSTSGTAEAAELEHADKHLEPDHHHHDHGGTDELATHGVAPDAHEPHEPVVALTRRHWWQMERQPVVLGTLYALGHAFVVALLGGAALILGAHLPEWVDPIMGRVVGATLLILGVWVFVSIYNYARHGEAFRLRSRWMLLFDGVRYGWRRFQARLHGHEHVEPLEMSSYGPKTAFSVGMIHGVGAETATQVLLIAAIGGASSQGLGIPMMMAFIVGLLVSNTVVILITSSGFLASQARQRVYLGIGVVAGAFSLVIGAAFLLGVEDLLPNLQGLFG